jgi:hypothetical protein
VPSVGDHPGAVERRADTRVVDRAVRPLVEAVELEAAVADRREVAEDRCEAAGQRDQRAEVGRVVREVAAAEVAGHRAVEARDRVADRPLLKPDSLARHQRAASVTMVAVLVRDRRAGERPDRGGAGRSRGSAHERPPIDLARHAHPPQ